MFALVDYERKVIVEVKKNMRESAHVDIQIDSEKLAIKGLITLIDKYEWKQFGNSLKGTRSKIFFLGPNKTGTRTLADMTRKLKYLTCHWMCTLDPKSDREIWVIKTVGNDGQTTVKLNTPIIEAYESFSDTVSPSLDYRCVTDIANNMERSGAEWSGATSRFDAASFHLVDRSFCCVIASLRFDLLRRNFAFVYRSLRSESF